LTVTDEALLKAIQAQSTATNEAEAAFETLLARYEAAIYRHIARTVRQPHTAADLVQEVFLRVWTHAEQWQGRGTVKSWLYTIATNLTLNQLRAHKRRPQTSLEPHVDQAETDLFEPAPQWLMKLPCAKNWQQSICQKMA
jgi:RNA polymerase sigma-70 factor (ECF subfamily)